MRKRFPARADEPRDRLRAARPADVDSSRCRSSSRRRSTAARPARGTRRRGLGGRAHLRGGRRLTTSPASAPMRRTRGACSTPASGATRAAPNYFGDACVWWGLWLVALAAGAPWWTVVEQVVMTVLLAPRLGRDAARALARAAAVRLRGVRAPDERVRAAAAAHGLSDRLPLTPARHGPARTDRRRSRGPPACARPTSGCGCAPCRAARRGRRSR